MPNFIDNLIARTAPGAAAAESAIRPRPRARFERTEHATLGPGDATTEPAESSAPGYEDASPQSAAQWVERGERHDAPHADAARLFRRYDNGRASGTTDVAATMINAPPTEAHAAATRNALALAPAPRTGAEAAPPMPTPYAAERPAPARPAAWARSDESDDRAGPMPVDQVRATPPVPARSTRRASPIEPAIATSRVRPVASERTHAGPITPELPAPEAAHGTAEGNNRAALLATHALVESSAREVRGVRLPKHAADAAIASRPLAPRLERTGALQTRPLRQTAASIGEPPRRETAPVVHVTIDRIDVHAAAPPVKPARSTPAPRRPALSLDAYLRQRNERAR